MTMNIRAAEAGDVLRQRVIDSMITVLPHLLRGRQYVITASTRLMEDLELRSATTLELLLEIEEDLAIRIDVDDMEPKDVESVATLAGYIAAHATPA